MKLKLITATMGNYFEDYSVHDDYSEKTEGIEFILDTG